MNYKEVKIPATKFAHSDKEVDKIFIKCPDSNFIWDNDELLDLVANSAITKKIPVAAFKPFLVSHLYLKKNDENSGLLQSDFKILKQDTRMALLIEFAGFCMAGQEED